MSLWIDREGYQERLAPHGTIVLEPRPHYCDRGRFIVKVYPLHPLGCRACDVDDADGFPRYYFDEERAKAEIQAWIEIRGWEK